MIGTLTLDPIAAKALSHPLRVRMLEGLGQADPKLGISPSALAERLGEPLANVAYHMRTLLDLGVVRLVRKKQRRGALEHFYVLTDAGAEMIVQHSRRVSLEESLSGRLAGAKDALDAVLQEWPDEADGSGLLEHAIELVGRCETELEGLEADDA